MYAHQIAQNKLLDQLKLKEAKIRLSSRMEKNKGRSWACLLFGSIYNQRNLCQNNKNRIPENGETNEETNPRFAPRHNR